MMLLQQTHARTSASLDPTHTTKRSNPHRERRTTALRAVCVSWVGVIKTRRDAALTITGTSATSRPRPKRTVRGSTFRLQERAQKNPAQSIHVFSFPRHMPGLPRLSALQFPLPFATAKPFAKQRINPPRPLKYPPLRPHHAASPLVLHGSSPYFII